MPATDGSGLVLIQAGPKADPSSPALAATVHQLRAHLPQQAKVGGAAVENLDLQHALNAKTPLVLGVILTLGFLLLPVLLRLMGRRTWSCPAWLARVLPDIRFSH
ncbi:putative membrane protein YdfJ with MMPL/SSD domain [Catenulispora sp. GP43]